ncbi:hypothetical protein [Streptomyces sp. Y1]|uniref:PPE family domain-containing protein n=1 Tax=Streptomyces sp. Y1 TaxID=3238634 RepID=A0AB39TJL7_9ACTN
MAGTTDFNQYSHSTLKGMVDGAKSQEVLSRALKLQQAGRVLSDLSTALQAHLGQVHWEGDAAEGFKTWVGNLYKSAAIIAKHSWTAGDAMNQAGEALTTARSAVPLPPNDAIVTVDKRKKQAVMIPANVESKLAVGGTIDGYMKGINKDWVTEDEAKQAQALIDKEKQEAVHQLEKLAQAYSAATTTLNGIDTNVVLPGTPGGDGSRGGSTDHPGSGGSGGYSGGSYHSPRISSGSTGGSYSQPVANYVDGSSVPRHPGSGADWRDPARAEPISSHGGGQLPSTPQDPGSSLPSHPSDPTNRPGTGLDSLPPTSTLPTQTGPTGPVPSGGPSLNPGYPSVPVGDPSGPNGLPMTNIPGGLPGSVPARNGSGPGRTGSIPPRTTPFGAGPMPGKAANPSLPTGPVVGGREVPAGGRAGNTSGMGGMHPGMGGHGAGGSGGSRGSRGRGLTSTSGGTIGGRKGPAAGGEFTPGGTGLRNRAGAGAAEGRGRSGQNGMMAPGGAGHAGRNERDRRKRADYLHEDEETWTSGTPHSNPDVIE